MAFQVAKQFSLTLVLISLFLSSSHARESQSFSKVSRATTTNFKGAAEYSNQQVEKTEEQPSFYKQDDDNLYGLYAASSPPAIDSSAEPKPTPPSEPTTSSWRPEYYNPYVTPVAEEYSAAVEQIPQLTGEETHSYSQLQRNEEYSNVDEERSFRTVPQPNPRYTATNKKYNPDSIGASYVDQQGMSDTRYLLNGKYYYNIYTNEFSKIHPYEVLKATNRNAQFNSYSSSNSENKYNSMEMNDPNEGRLFEQEDNSDMP